MSTDRSRRQQGFTFVEMAVALGILTLLSLAVERTLTSAGDNERFLTATRRATERGQQLCYEVFRSVSSSRKLLQDDAVGQGYLDALDLTRHPLADGSRLPLIDEIGELGPDDPGVPMTGNILLFVEETDPIACVADGASGTIRYVDSYRFVCVYRTATTVLLLTAEPPACDLVVWRSVPYPSRAQLLAIDDADERRNVVLDLRDRHGHETVWSPGAPVASGFYALSALGVVATVPNAAAVVEEEPGRTTSGRLVAAFVQLAPTDDDSARRKAVFTRDAPEDWSPDGFEVKVAGASGSRKVWVHVVVESPAGGRRAAVHASTMIASTRDL